MMQGDDIRNQRQLAEKDATWSKPGADPQEEACYHMSRGVLALWTIAEQLFELRENFAMVIDGAASIRTRTGD